ncbi:carboxypeptidase regulatory-like domain-containing protein [Bradyrhizobium sp. 14AA]
MKFARITAAWLSASALLHVGVAFAATVDISAHDIGGQVIGDNGPEAGVWVIAETKDLPTKYAKVVVTDDQGRFVIPDLPDAGYKIWVRGYGLQDSAPIDARRGKLVSFKAAPAPSLAAAAQLYPGMYWYSLLEIPAANEFPGTGDKGNKMPETMKSQQQWIDTVKNMCQSCHALGTRGIREVPKVFMDGNNSHTAWALRTQAGQAMEYMALALGSMGPEKVYSLFSRWTDRIAEGELPFDKPERPKGIERNVVYTMWDWASPKHYQHDAISTDKRNPTVNANGLIYGSPEESTDLIPTLDPIKNVAATIKQPYLDPQTASSADAPQGPSAYWGDEPIWDGHTSIHNVIMDEQGKVWFTARLRPPENPDYCKQGSSHPSAKIAPQATSLRQLSRFDPVSGKWDLINTCFSTHHLYFGHDPRNTLWMSAGGPGLGGGIVGWLNTKQFRETGDQVASQGWTPLVIDTNGNGRRDDYVEAKDPLDPSKDKRIAASFYGIMPSPVDDSIWGQSMDRGFSRIDQPGYIVRVVPGPDPAKTALAEVYQPPEGTFGPRGIDIGLDGVVWTALSSGHLASFDRKLCNGPINGPSTADGKQCPEGWKVFRLPGPQFRGLDPKGSANHAYYVWVDRYNALGLGANVPIASANGGESLLALLNGEFVTLRVPYPLGFFTKNVDGRIDDPSTGWKGRGVWTTSGTRANFHGEGGKEAYPKVFKVQMRPDPLAH